MPGGPMECASLYAHEDHAPIWSLPGPLNHGNTTGPVLQDLPRLAQEISDCETGFSREDHGFTSADPAEPPSRPEVPYYTLPCQTNPQNMSGYISMEQHERAMKHNAELAQELMRARDEARKAREETEQAKLAFRTLANWTYHERQMFLDGLKSMRLEAEEHIKAGVQEVKDVLVGDPRVTDTMNAEHSGVGEDYEPPEFIRGSSMDDAIDELIAEEKAKLTYASS